MYEKSTRLTRAGGSHSRDTPSCSRSVQSRQNICRVASSDEIILVLALKTGQEISLMDAAYVFGLSLSSFTVRL